MGNEGLQILALVPIMLLILGVISGIGTVLAWLVLCFVRWIFKKENEVKS